MNNVSDMVSYLDSQISYHTYMLGKHIADSEKRSLHESHAKSNRAIKAFLEGIKPESSHTKLVSKKVVAQPSTESRSDRRSSEMPASETRSVYTSEFISAQPVTKQLDYKILNTIYAASNKVTPDHISDVFYKTHKQVLDRRDLGRSLTRLVRQGKIEHLHRNAYRKIA